MENWHEGQEALCRFCQLLFCHFGIFWGYYGQPCCFEVLNYLVDGFYIAEQLQKLSANVLLPKGFVGQLVLRAVQLVDV